MIPRDATAAAHAGGWTPMSLLVALLLGAAAVPALGPPDLALAGDFLSSGRPTREGALAAVQLVVWSMVVLLVLLLVVYALRGSLGVSQGIKKRRFRARASLLLGILIFSGGAVHHQALVGPICCGDVDRAVRLLR